MKGFLYMRLAWQNIKNNRRTYVPYTLTVIGTILIYYSFHCIADNPGLLELRGGGWIKNIMGFGKNVITIFAIVFLFYTNSFLVKRRKREFALFNILGMEKRHLGRVLLWETVYVALIGFTAGIGGGILLSKLMYLLLLRLMTFPVQMGFFLSRAGVWYTVELFGIIFLAIWLNALRQIRTASPIELLQEGKAGEREPKTKALMAAAGLVCLAAGYTIAVVTESPLSALGLFFVAVLLVIVGTYLLFTAGSIAWLKLLRKRTGYYYRTRHFISVSGMLYRMKQNAVGLANICILSTMVLVMLSTTTALYAGTEDTLYSRCPRELVVEADGITAQEAQTYEQAVTRRLLEQFDVMPQEQLGYRYRLGIMLQEGSRLMEINDQVIGGEKAVGIQFIPLDELRFVGPEKIPAELAPDEVLVCSLKGTFSADSVTIGGREYRVAGQLSAADLGFNTGAYLRSYMIIMSDETAMAELFESGLSETESFSGEYQAGRLSYMFGFDIKDTAPAADVEEILRQAWAELGREDGPRIETQAENWGRLYRIHGGLLFLGVFLGLLFWMGMILIMYYKQISEGYEDRERYQIMRKVGLGKDEVKAAIGSQILQVFFLPLAAAALHMAFAFPLIARLMELANMYNTKLYLWTTMATVLVFAILYGIVYRLTARVYYRLVSEQDGGR